MAYVVEVGSKAKSDAVFVEIHADSEQRAQIRF